ncbi:MAG TPA: glycosyltransferase family 2 protein [Candidatus Binatia bacterium]|nr:glycosyltransferase family 2 protein [Candidatus Binatia bacterium]
MAAPPPNTGLPIPPGAPPHVTVITVVRNARATLPATIESVLAQTHRPLEYLVLDGASTDGTLDLLRAYEGRLRFESAPDGGIYDAMNRAVARVERRDSYLFFLNADDRFVGPDAVARAVGGGEGADFVHCLLEWRDDALRTREIVGGPVSLGRLRLQNRCGHQMIFCRRSVFDTAGGFDLRYPIAADYDWAIRVFQRPEITKRFVPEVAASMGAGGVSERRYLRLLRERGRIVRERFGAQAAVEFALFAAAVEIPRLAVRRLLGAVGMLRAARLVRRAVSGTPRSGAQSSSP